MKLHNLFAGLLLATSVSMSAGALAADGDKPVADAPAEKATTPAKKKMKPHSHMEEKGGWLRHPRVRMPTRRPIHRQATSREPIRTSRNIFIPGMANKPRIESDAP